MSGRALTWAYQQHTGSTIKKALLASLADQANDDGFCYPGQASLAKRLECGQRTVRRGLKELEQDGFLTRSPRFWEDTHRRRTDYYYLAVCDVEEPPATVAASQDPPATDARATGHTGQKPPATVAAHEPPDYEPPEEPPDISSFEDFWKVYPQQPNGTKPDRVLADKQWGKLKPPERERALIGAAHYQAACASGTFAKHAHRWLRDRTFEDWQAPATAASPNGRGGHRPYNDSDEWGVP